MKGNICLASPTCRIHTSSQLILISTLGYNYYSTSYSLSDPAIFSFQNI